MQFAINVAIFILGYAIAFAVVAKPKEFRKSLAQFSGKLRFVTNGLKSSSPSTKAEEAELLPQRRESLSNLECELLTKYVIALHDERTFTDCFAEKR